MCMNNDDDYTCKDKNIILSNTQVSNILLLFKYTINNTSLQFLLGWAVWGTIIKT